jgi:hypothetical protein
MMSDEFDQVPLNTTDFIALLDEQYPHRILRVGENLEMYQRYCGIRELIDELLIVKHELEEGDDQGNES